MATQLQKISPPALIQSPAIFDRSYNDQNNNILRLFFNRLTNVLNLLVDPTYGGANLYFPYGSFYSTVDQTAAATTDAYVITYNNTYASLGVSVVSNSRITVTQAGMYNLQFSIQFANTDSQLHDADVWVRVNGVDLTNSNSIFSIPNSHGGVNGHIIAALNIFVQLNVNDYVELVWHVSNTACFIDYTTTAVTPTRPATPSVIATLSLVSNV